PRAPAPIIPTRTRSFAPSTCAGGYASNAAVPTAVCRINSRLLLFSMADTSSVLSLHAQFIQVLRNDLCVVGDCDLGLLQFGMPRLRPLERKIAVIVDLLQSFNLPLDRYLAAAGKYIAALVALGLGILQVRVMDVFSQLRDGELGLFLAVNESMMRVPQQSNM